jgi:hypothetical protein
MAREIVLVMTARKKLAVLACKTSLLKFYTLLRLHAGRDWVKAQSHQVSFAISLNKG